MSLINEALKRAQSGRPSTDPVNPGPGVPGGPGHYQHPRKRRSYLWGFLMAVLVVGILSAGITTILVYQLLGKEKPAQSPVAAAVTEPAQPAVAEAPVTSAPAGLPEPAPAAEPPAAAAADAPSTEPAVPAAIASAPEAVVPALPEPVPAPAAPAPAAAPAAEPIPAGPPARQGTNPMIWSRLQELEIRGIMSGGTKVLIFDNRAGKSRSYRKGELVDGTLGITLSVISPNQLVFEDYDGSFYNKIF